jgi:hypothetical protein
MVLLSATRADSGRYILPDRGRCHHLRDARTRRFPDLWDSPWVNRKKLIPALWPARQRLRDLQRAEQIVAIRDGERRLRAIQQRIGRMHAQMNEAGPDFAAIAASDATSCPAEDGSGRAILEASYAGFGQAAGWLRPLIAKPGTRTDALSLKSFHR